MLHSKSLKRSYTGCIEFEWDPAKAALRKHRITFQEAATVFGDFLGATVADPDRSISEKRFITIGTSSRNRLLIVAHAQRGERVRIIGAQKLTRRERITYESA